MDEPANVEELNQRELLTRLASGMSAQAQLRQYEESAAGRRHRSALIGRVVGDLDAHLWNRIEAATTSHSSQVDSARVSSTSYDPTANPLFEWRDPSQPTFGNVAASASRTSSGDAVAAVALRYGLSMTDVAFPGTTPSFAELAQVAVRVRPPAKPRVAEPRREAIRSAAPTRAVKGASPSSTALTSMVVVGGICAFILLIMYLVS